MIISLILALAVCPIALMVGDLAEAERSIAMLLDYSSKHALNIWNAFGRCWKGSLLLAKGDTAGLAVLRSALDWLREARFVFRRAMFLGTLAQGLGAAGRIAEARVAIDEALEQSDRTEERWCLPELLRIKGEILMSDGTLNAARESEGYFLQALDWARRLEAPSWELRAATSLAKLWRRDGQTAKAKELLSSVYDRFTEGFETADLKAARASIDTFRNGPS